jgi:formylglycine-generating enzyme required for sulfatase activity
MEEWMMGKKVLMVLAALILMYGLIACGKKEAEPQEEAVAEQEAPAIVPGEMVLIPEGEFILGTNDKESNAYPEQKIKLPAYWIDKYEVTNTEFLEFSIKNSYAGEGAKEGHDWRLFFTSEKGMFPVVYITWNDADAYCKAQGKRLPTEEEWEKAARGTEGFIYPWGNEWQDGMSNTYESGPGKAVAIGEFNDVSPFGVHDMLGNVQEWTASWYSSYKGNPKRDPKSGQTLRVVRGLASRYRGKMGHLYDRSAQQPNALYDFGCRCAKDATPEDVAQAAQAR